jgi:hypothetical protein
MNTGSPGRTVTAVVGTVLTGVVVFVVSVDTGLVVLVVSVLTGLVVVVVSRVVLVVSVLTGLVVVVVSRVVLVVSVLTGLLVVVLSAVVVVLSAVVVVLSAVVVVVSSVVLVVSVLTGLLDVVLSAVDVVVSAVVLVVEVGTLPHGGWLTTKLLNEVTVVPPGNVIDADVMVNGPPDWLVVASRKWAVLLEASVNTAEPELPLLKVRVTGPKSDPVNFPLPCLMPFMMRCQPSRDGSQPPESDE